MRTLSCILLALLLCACATQPAPESPAPPTPTPESSVVAHPTPTPTPHPTPTPAPKPAKPKAPAKLSATQAGQLINALLPERMPDRAGWRTDILDAFAGLKLPYTPEYFCAAMAVIEQESSWQGDPTVPGLGDIVWREIDERASRYNVPLGVVKAALLKPSPTGESYKSRIDNLRTEREMNALFEDMSREAAKLGLPLNMKNPIRTGGPMQVSVAFAESHVRSWHYPYPRPRSVRNEVFTRRGGTYFGIAYLLQYPAGYDDMRYRFADYNAGRYASRNTAFQGAVSRLAGRELDLDGDLLSYNANGRPQSSKVEALLQGLGRKLGLNDKQIRQDLLKEKLSDFSRTITYQRVYEAADAQAGRAWPREAMPQIRLISPKISRKLTTEWFADRVDGRYQRCLGRTPAAYR
ncbi:DUF1615 domain-containing protein [Chitinibacteraceae bacterium HSL-7]